MSESNTYKTIINEKFSDFSFQDMDTTWLDMKDILDKEMPQKKKRRFLLWLNWYTGTALFLLGVSVIALTIFGYQHSNEKNVVQENTRKNISVTQNQHNILQSTSSEDNNEPQIKAKQKTKSTERTRNLIKTQLSVSESKNTVGNSYKKNTVIKSVVENNTSNKITQSTSVNKIGFDKEQNQDKTVSKTHTTIPDNTINQKGPLVIPEKENKTDDVVISENQKHSNELPVTKAGIVKLSDQKVVNPEEVNPDEVNDLTPIIDSLLNTSTDSASVSGKKTPNRKNGKGWVIGASLNYNLPVSNQEMSTVNMNGKKSTLVDFLPSVYAQYHFNDKLHLESSFQFSSPQYISNHKLAASYKDLDPTKKEENAVWLNKLYYLNIPVSLHYKVMPNMTIGSGIQYSYLRRSVFADEIAIWEKQGAGWAKTASQKTIAVKSNAAVKKEKSNNGNGNGGGTPPPPAAPISMIDTVAQTLKSSDLRLLFDVNYSLKRLNMGIRFNMGLNNYINTTSGGNVLPVKDKNQALQLYMRYDIFDKRKKK